MKESKIIPKVIKIGLLGDTNVGKTAICNSFLGIEFSQDMIITIGHDKLEKKVKVNNDEEIKLIYYDTAGVKNMRAISLKAVKNVQGIILVFDLGNRETFDNLDNWFKDIKDNLNAPIIILFGNKADLNKWEATSEEVNNYVKNKSIAYFEVSAKTGKGINEGFSYITNEICNNFYMKEKYIKEDNNEIIIKKDDIIKEKKKDDCIRNKKKK